MQKASKNIMFSILVWDAMIVFCLSHSFQTTIATLLMPIFLYLLHGQSKWFKYSTAVLVTTYSGLLVQLDQSLFALILIILLHLFIFKFSLKPQARISTRLHTLLMLSGLIALAYGFAPEIEENYLLTASGLIIFFLSWFSLHPQLLRLRPSGLLLTLLLTCCSALSLSYFLTQELKDYNRSQKERVAIQQAKQDPEKLTQSKEPNQRDPNKRNPEKPKRDNNASEENSDLDLEPPQDGDETQLVAYLKFSDAAPQHKTMPPLYLREYAYSLFDSSLWKIDNTLRSVTSDKDDGVIDGWSTVAPPREQQTLNYEIYLLQRNSRRLLVLPGMTRIKADQVQTLENDCHIGVFKRQHLLAYTAQSTRQEYRLLPKKDLRPGKASSQFLQIPSGVLFEKISAKAKELTQGIPGTSEKISAIHRFLSENYQYEIIRSRQNLDTLEDFFLHSKKGQCTLFASTFTLMLRAINIPSRVAAGYCSGDYDPKDKVYQFAQGQRHAWSEIYFEKYGWITYDATPAGSIGNPQAFRSEFEELREHFEFESPQEKLTTPEENPVSDTETTPEALAQKEASEIIIYTLLLLSLLCLLMKIGKIIFTKKPPLALENEIECLPQYLPLTEFFEIFCQCFDKIGHMKKSSETAREYLQRLKQEKLISTQFDPLIHYYYQLRYEEIPANLQREQEFITAIKKFENDLHAQEREEIV